MIEEWYFKKASWSKKLIHPQELPVFDLFKGKILIHLLMLLFICVIIILNHSTFSTENISDNIIIFFLSMVLVISGTSIITIYMGIQKGKAWFNTKDPKELEIKKKDLDKRLEDSFFNIGINVEKEFADIVYENQIKKFRVRDGVGKHRGSVSVDVEWSASLSGNPKLYIYRDEKEIQENVTNIKNRSTAIKLDFQEQGKSSNITDVDVVLGKKYFYYTWIEVEMYHGLLVFCFKRQDHVVRLAETFEEYTSRFSKNLQTKAKLNALKPSKKPLGTKLERIKEEIEKRVSAKTSKKERWKDIDDYVDNLDLTDEEKDDVLAESLDVIQRIENEPDTQNDNVVNIEDTTNYRK